MTIPLTAISFSLAMVIAVAVAPGVEVTMVFSFATGIVVNWIV